MQVESCQKKILRCDPEYFTRLLVLSLVDKEQLVQQLCSGGRIPVEDPNTLKIFGCQLSLAFTYVAKITLTLSQTNTLPYQDGSRRFRRACELSHVPSGVGVSDLLTEARPEHTNSALQRTGLACQSHLRAVQSKLFYLRTKEQAIIFLLDVVVAICCFRKRKQLAYYTANIGTRGCRSILILLLLSIDVQHHQLVQQPHAIQRCPVMKPNSF